MGDVARLLPLAETVAEVVRDGDTVAFEGFPHLIPYAAGREAIRQGRRDLTLSIGDGILAETADAVYWIQPGRTDVGFLAGELAALRALRATSSRL